MLEIQDLINALGCSFLPSYKYKKEMMTHAMSLYRYIGNDVAGVRGVKLILSMTKWFDDDYDTRHFRGMMKCYIDQVEALQFGQVIKEKEGRRYIEETERRIMQNCKSEMMGVVDGIAPVGAWRGQRTRLAS